MAYRVVHYRDFESMAPRRAAWDRLAGGIPFRSWSWLSTWWRHYGAPGSLRIAVVVDAADEPVAIAPWMVRRSLGRGTVLHWLGSGEVCSDHLGVLAAPGCEAVAAEALANWLASGEGRRWDAMALWHDGGDAVARRLVERLGDAGGAFLRPGMPCWRLALPPTWNDYLEMLSKSHRKQVRRLEREAFHLGRTKLHTAATFDELARGMAIFADLHQKRRQSLGEPGRFHSRRFAAFHREVAPRQFAEGSLELHWLEYEGQPVAAEYHLVGPRTIYAYQSGIEPAALSLQPGRLITLALVRRAIERGATCYDFLRGDEPYKAHWRAEPQPTEQLCAASLAAAARLRLALWRAGSNLKRWFRTWTLANASC